MTYIGHLEKTWGSSPAGQTKTAISRTTGCLYWFNNSTTVSRYDPATGVLTSSWGTVPANTSRAGIATNGATLAVLVIIGGVLKEYTWNLATTPGGGAATFFTNITYTGSALTGIMGGLDTPSATVGQHFVFSDTGGNIWDMPTLSTTTLVHTYASATVSDIMESSSYPGHGYADYFIADSANNLVKKVDGNTHNEIESYAVTNPRFLVYGSEEQLAVGGPFGLMRVITADGSQILLKSGNVQVVEIPPLHSSVDNSIITPFASNSVVGAAFDFNRDRWWGGSSAKLWWWERKLVSPKTRIGQQGGQARIRPKMTRGNNPTRIGTVR